MHIRKIITSAEEIYSEAGKSAEIPLRKVAVVAVIKNPFANQTYKEDLSTLTEASEKIGIRIAEIAGDAMEPYSIESYGKASIVGVAGEQQHGSAMVTTLFGDKMRKVAGGGEAWIPSTSKRMEAGGIIDVPLAHKDALYVRSHYDTMTHQWRARHANDTLVGTSPSQKRKEHSPDARLLKSSSSIKG